MVISLSKEDYTIVDSSNTSVVKREQELAQHSEQAVVPHLIQIGEQYFNKDEVLEAAIVLLRHMSHQMLSPDAMYIAFMGAKNEMPQYAELIAALFEGANKLRKGNRLSGMF